MWDTDFNSEISFSNLALCSAIFGARAAAVLTDGIKVGPGGGMTESLALSLIHI